MLIKAGRITNLTDARYFAAREVDYLGFNLEEGTDGYLDPMFMHAIREWVEGPKIVGEFRNSAPEAVREAVAFFQLDAVQVPASFAYADLTPAFEVLFWLPPAETAASTGRLMADFAGENRLFVLELSGHAALQAPDDWRQLFERFPCLLHLDAPLAMWPQIAGRLAPSGFSLVGGDEEQVGVKSFELVDEIFDALGR